MNKKNDSDAKKKLVMTQSECISNVLQKHSG